jgi:hypothetical protein
MEFLPERQEEIDNRYGEEEEAEPWIETIDRIDSTDFSRLFRNTVLLAGLLHLRDDSLSALKDLETIIQETESFSRRIASAKEKHPEVDILRSIEKNIGEFSIQTGGFHNALVASELRGELELLSLSLVLSRSPSPESRMWKTNLAKKITRLARHLKLKDDGLKERNPLSSGESPAMEEGNR